MKTLRSHIQPAQWVNPSYSSAELVADIEAGEPIDGFFGGIERTLIEAEAYVLEDGRKLLEVFMYRESLDGLKVAIYIANPTVWKNGRCTTQSPNTPWAILDTFIDSIATHDSLTRVEVTGTIMTKSEFKALLTSEQYLTTSEVIQQN